MKLELKIVDLLARNQGKKLAINEIAKALKEHYSFVHRIVNNLIKDKVVIKEKVGKSHICSLDIKNEKTIALMHLSEIEKKDEFYASNKELGLVLEDFSRSVKSDLNITSIVLFGSYAKGTAKKDSDIDILILSKRKVDVDKIIKEIYAKYGREINAINMACSDFKKQKDKPLIKEIINNHYIIYGAEEFINCLLK